MKLDRKIGFVTIAVMVTMAARASAQSPPPGAEAVPPAEPRDAARSPPPPPRWMPLSGFGMTLAAGAGVTDFVDSGARALTKTGASWNIRMAFGTRRVLGGEISYVGGANMIHGLGFDTADTKLIRNGIEVAARLNAPLYVKQTLVEPYFAGGAGWNSYRITNVTTASASASPTDTNTIAIPLAIGVAVGYKGFVADARTTIRPTFRQTTLRDEGSAALTNWEIGGMVGFEF
jgi:hypothetical protein